MSINFQQPAMMGGYGVNPMGYNFQPNMVYGNPMFYTQPQQATVKVSNPIGKKGYDLLRARSGRINFNPTEEEIFRCLCTHVHDGNFSMLPETPGSNVWRCQICDTVVDFGADFDQDLLEASIKYLEGAWNHIKIMNNGVLGEEILRDMGCSMVLVKRIPAMYDLTSKQFNKVQNAAAGAMNFGGLGLQNFRAITDGNGGFTYIPTMPTGGYGAPIPQSGLGGMNPFIGPNPGMGYGAPMAYAAPPAAPAAPMGMVMPQPAAAPTPMAYTPMAAHTANPQPQPQGRVLIDPQTGQQVIVPVDTTGYVSPFANPMTTPPGAVGTVMPQPTAAPVMPTAPAAPTAAPEAATPGVASKTFNG